MVKTVVHFWVIKHPSEAGQVDARHHQVGLGLSNLIYFRCKISKHLRNYKKKNRFMKSESSLY